MSTLLLSALLPLACTDTKVAVYNTAPTATITDPADGTAYAGGDLIEFRGLVLDGQEDAPELTVLWTSSLDGEIGSSEADIDGLVFFPTTDLTAGLHAITLSAIDEEGKIGEETITVDVGTGSTASGEPTLILVGPLEGEVYTFSETVTVVATASDVEQSADTLSASIISSRDGTLWTGTPASNGAITESFSGLGVGPHNIAVTIQDADGNLVSESVNIEIAEDGAPDVSIISPAASSSWWTDEQITFEGLVGDDLSDPMDLLVEWESSLDGLLYSGFPDSSGFTAFGAYLSEGLHVISLTAIDEDLNSTSTSQTVTIIDPLGYDNDGDGQSELDGDCDDTDPSVYDGAPEQCDEVDNDCNGLNNEDWWDNPDSATGSDNDSQATAYDLSEVDSDWPWGGDYIEVTPLTLHDPDDEDWFIFDVDDDILDNANFSVKITGLYSGATWVIELYSLDTGRLEDSASGSGSLTVSYSGDWLDDDEDNWAVRVYIASGTWPGGGICTTAYSLEINA